MMSDKRVESLQIGVDEVVRLRRENEEAVRLLRDVSVFLWDIYLPDDSEEVEARKTKGKIDAYLAKRKEG